MKKMILIAAMILSSSAFAQDVFVKECSTSMENLESGQVINMVIRVTSGTNDVLSATILQQVNGIVGSYVEPVEMLEESVRPNLSASSDPATLNQAEALIVHAMLLSENPMFKGIFSAGIDLQKVRSAKLYLIGEKTNMGLPAIVEARDVNGQVLGSFFGGFLVSPCK